MTDYKSFIIVATFFSLWIAVFFSYEVENFLAYILILSFGIIHGSNDLKLVERKYVNLKKSFFIKILSIYVLFVLGTSVIFYFFPMIALTLFVLFSGYHFGEEHLSNTIKRINVVASFTYLFHGLLLFSIIFYTNYSSVSTIIKEITDIDIPYIFFRNFFYISLSLIVISFLLHLKTKTVTLLKVIEESFYLLILYVIFRTASLIWSFAIYFVFWHSIPSLIRQVNYLYGNYKLSSFREYLRSSFVYWLISIIGLGVIYFLFSKNQTYFTPILFILLACITFPHVWIISRLDKDY
ncbi:Brp/Blh family beta-carotene 15,15'-dioxygenase [Tenacibaculum sp. 190524A05c]|uniref:Brp/Blh family beta-carotene 15,15'-dioxygenase n=1 Tax=Tenacibaculum platacis TaxID=3137852 RepID=UPI0031FB761F